MKLFRPFIVSIAILPFLFLSCADEKSVGVETIQKNLLEAYMVVTYGEDRTAWPAQADMGYYYIPLRSTGGTSAPADDKWIRYDITSVAQDGTLVYTTFADIAKQHNVFSYFTHYTPEYYAMGDDYGYIPKGIADALKNHTKVGDSIRLILYPDLMAGSAYLPTINTGKPVVLDIAVRDVVTLPQAQEEADLLDYKHANYPMAAALKGESGADTTGIFFQELIPQPVADDIVIEETDTVWVKYTGRYLDGYMFDTNIIDSARAHNIYSYAPSKYEANGMQFVIGSGEAVKGFDEALKNMKVGSSAVVMFTSSWGYGVLGDNNKGPNYTSMVFHIQVIDVGKGEGKSSSE